jgi:arylsulfatase A-like enzyme
MLLFCVLQDINKPYRGWKATLFEGGLRVPFLMSWPAGLPADQAGAVFPFPVSHVDMFATAAAAAGSPVPPRGAAGALDGVDLVPYLTGGAQGASHLAEASESESDSEEKENPIPHETLFWRSGHYKALHYRDKWKLQVSEMPARRWLFDTAEDPTEQTNLAADPAFSAVLGTMLELMRAEDRAQSAPLWPALSATYIPIDKVESEPQSASDEYVLWEN